MSLPRVCIVPEFPLSLMTGGTLLQATETRKALAQHVPGMSFELFNWSDVETPADCYHFIGLPKYLAGLCSLLTQAQRPYVLTLLLGGQNRRRLWLATWRRRTASWLGPSREHQKAIEKASAIITLTSEDAEAASIIFRIPRSRIQLVPVAVSDFYFQATPELWISQYGAAPFVLCVGAIQERKKQLSLARACNRLRLPLVLVGAVLPGNDAYVTQVRSAMAENEKLGGRWLRCSDPVLASAYAACRMFVLLSASETQPASVLQAMALRKPVLLAAAPYAQGHPFRGLPQVNSEDEPKVVVALQRLWNEGSATELPEEFRWPNVCQRLASIYTSILRKR